MSSNQTQIQELTQALYELVCLLSAASSEMQSAGLIRLRKALGAKLGKTDPAGR